MTKPTFINWTLIRKYMQQQKNGKKQRDDRKEKIKVVSIPPKIKGVKTLQEGFQNFLL